MLFLCIVPKGVHTILQGVYIFIMDDINYIQLIQINYKNHVGQFIGFKPNKQSFEFVKRNL